MTSVREFFISALDKLILVFLGLMALGVLIGAVTIMSTEGFFAGLALLIMGAVYIMFIGGMMFLVLGIYENTKRTAAALENRP